MGNYYLESMNAIKLYSVYQTEIERVKQYLDSEIEFVRSQLPPDSIVLEMGAGYGRVMKRLSPSVKFIYGLDISEDSAAFGQAYLKQCPNCRLSVLDIYQFDSKIKFDAVLCLQNGLSAIKGSANRLVEIAMGLLKEDGKAFFSSYSAKVWDVRLAWFQEQADKGLLGEIDYESTGDGKIVCRDGFTATTFSFGDMERLGEASGCRYTVQEVDDSSIFLTIKKRIK